MTPPRLLLNDAQWPDSAHPGAGLVIGSPHLRGSGGQPMTVDGRNPCDPLRMHRSARVAAPRTWSSGVSAAMPESDPRPRRSASWSPSDNTRDSEQVRRHLQVRCSPERHSGRSRVGKRFLEARLDAIPTCCVRLGPEAVSDRLPWLPVTPLRHPERQEAVSLTGPRLEDADQETRSLRYR